MQLATHNGLHSRTTESYQVKSGTKPSLGLGWDEPCWPSHSMHYSRWRNLITWFINKPIRPFNMSIKHSDNYSQGTSCVLLATTFLNNPGSSLGLAQDCQAVQTHWGGNYFVGSLEPTPGELFYGGECNRQTGLG